MATNEDRAAHRALDALDSMAAEWVDEADIREMAATIALKPDRVDRIVAFVKQAFVEGAYKCYRDAADGHIPWLKPVQ